MEPLLTEEESNLVYDTCMFDEIKRAIDILRFDFTDLDANTVRCIRKGFLERNGIE